MGGVARDDVVAAYLAILGREPESEAAIASHLDHPTPAALINAVSQSGGRRSQLNGKDRPQLNPFVYLECQGLDVSGPDIPVALTEHYGQCAEDLIVSALLKAWSLKQDVDLAQATYLEIGGNHPIATSASFLLNRVHGMRGVVVEANPELLPALNKVRNFDAIVYGAMQVDDVESVTLSIANLSELSSLDQSSIQYFVQYGVRNAPADVEERTQIRVPALRINSTIERYFDGQAPHFLSIDIEGLDLPVLRDLDFERFRPIVIQVEPSDHHLPGATGQMIDFLRKKNYALVATTPVNLLFMAMEALWREDPAPVVQRANPGNALSRLIGFARRNGIIAAFKLVLSKCRKVALARLGSERSLVYKQYLLRQGRLS
jgi:FkbM family methyltransferase